jgi:hypothetical protein
MKEDVHSCTGASFRLQYYLVAFLLVKCVSGPILHRILPAAFPPIGPPGPSPLYHKQPSELLCPRSAVPAAGRGLPRAKVSPARLRPARTSTNLNRTVSLVHLLLATCCSPHGPAQHAVRAPPGGAVLAAGPLLLPGTPPRSTPPGGLETPGTVPRPTWQRAPPAATQSMGPTSAWFGGQERRWTPSAPVV